MSYIKNYWMDLQEEEERAQNEEELEEMRRNPVVDWDYDELYRDAYEDDPEASWGREW